MDLENVHVGDWMEFISPNDEKLFRSTVSIGSLFSAYEMPPSVKLKPIPLTPDILKNSLFEVSGDPSNDSYIVCWTGYGKTTKMILRLNFSTIGIRSELR